MRLVTGSTCHSTSPNPIAVVLAIQVREPVSGVILADLSLQITVGSVQITPMTAVSLGHSGAVTIASPSREPIAGKIEAQASPLGEAIILWGEYLTQRRRKPKSVEAFRQTVTKAARECGWASVSDVTFDAVTHWMGQHPAWKGSTYNRHLSAFRSFSSYLKSSGKLESDPLVDTQRAIDDGGDGARAATLEEARAIILRAWVRDQADRRCKGNRALYWMCLFAGACRLDEPSRWRRKHLVLDHAPPFVAWTSDINKNRKKQEVALSPELAELLKAHLRADDVARAAEGRPRAGPDDRVFPTIPNKGTFTKDRDAAGVRALDHRGRGFSPHSARKFFSTVLTGLGVAEKMVDRLMRHSGKVEQRYYDPTLAEQAAEVAKLPRLWPEQAGPTQQEDGSPIVDNSGNSGLNLTRSGKGAHYVGGTRQEPPATSQSVKRPGPPSEPCRVPTTRTDGGLGRAIDGLMRAAGKGRDGHNGRVESRPIMEPEIGISGSITAQDLNNLADLFDVLSRLLRNRSSGHDGRSQASPEEN